jgi:hypothetical protein
MKKYEVQYMETIRTLKIGWRLVLQNSWVPQKHIIDKYTMIPAPPLPEASILMKAPIVLFHICVFIKPCEPWLKKHIRWDEVRTHQLILLYEWNWYNIYCFYYSYLVKSNIPMKQYYMKDFDVSFLWSGEDRTLQEWPTLQYSQQMSMS